MNLADEVLAARLQDVRSKLDAVRRINAANKNGFRLDIRDVDDQTGLPETVSAEVANYCRASFGASMHPDDAEEQLQFAEARLALEIRERKLQAKVAALSLGPQCSDSDPEVRYRRDRLAKVKP